MFTPVRMCRLECVIAHNTKDMVIKRLHHEGLAQVDYLGEDELKDTGVERDSPLERAAEVSSLLLRVRSALEALRDYGETGGGFIEELLGVERVEKVQVKDSGYRKLNTQAERTLSQVEGEIEYAVGELRELEEQKRRLREQLVGLEPVRQLNISSTYFNEGPYLYSTIGALPQDAIEGVTARLGEEFRSEYCMQTLCESTGCSVRAFHVVKERGGELQQILRAFGFDEIRVEGGGSFRDAYDNLLRQTQGIESAVDELTRTLQSMHGEKYGGLLVLEELLALEEQRCTVFSNFGSTGKVTYLRLWVPKANCGRTVNLIEEETQGLCTVEVDDEADDAPTLLDNPPYLKPFESFTRLYSPPKYNQIDPTVITAPTMVIFFGYMLGDAVYGAAITAIALLLRRRYGRYSEKVKDFTFILLACGLSALVFGMLTGGYLGDFLSKYVLGIPTRDMPLVLIDPLYKSSAVKLLTVAVAVGVLHTILGNLLGIIDKFGRRDVKGALTANGSWLIMGAAVPVWYFINQTAGAVIFIAGFILLLIGSGMMAVMELPGIIGKVVSYARLLALSLTTPAMGMAFNFLIAMSLRIPYVGYPIALSAFILSHTMILFMNSLGSFVHSLRLHYVEFYGTFYGGGGVEYTPFMERRRHTIRR